MKLVPTFPTEGHHTLTNGSSIDFNDSRFHSRYSVWRGSNDGGMHEKHTGTQRYTREEVDCLEGVISVIED